MRRLSLFVHLPVFEELVSVIDTTAEQDMFSIYPLQLDADLFPILMEAKPCVLLMPVTQASLNENYQLLKDFKDYRLAHGGQARDPALRIVVISERDAPRGNWTLLGTYELMTGPVLSNVFSFKMARHYHKALSVSEFAPELPVVSEEVFHPEAKVAADDRDWKSFKIQNSKPERGVLPEASSHSPPPQFESKVFTITLQIPELKPDEGSWVQKDGPEQFEEHWEWDPLSQDSAAALSNSYSWQFTGEKPKYIASRKTWEFQSDHPKLYKTRNSDRGVSKLDPLLELTTDPKREDQIRAKAELRVESIKKKTYGAPLAPSLKMPKEAAENKESSGSVAAPKLAATPKPSLEEAIKKRSEHLAELKQHASSDAKHLSELQETEAPGKAKSPPVSAGMMAKMKSEVDFSSSAEIAHQDLKAVHISTHAAPKILKEAEESGHTQIAALIGEDSSGEKTRMTGTSNRESSHPALPKPAKELASSAKFQEPSDARALTEPSDNLPGRSQQAKLSSRAMADQAQKQEGAMKAKGLSTSALNANRLSKTGSDENPSLTATKKNQSEHATEPPVRQIAEGVEEKNGFLGSSPSDSSWVQQSKSANSPAPQKEGATVITADRETSSWSSLFDDNEKGSLMKKSSQAKSSAKSRKGWRLRYIKNSKKKKLSLAAKVDHSLAGISGPGAASLMRRMIAYIREQLGLKSEQ